MAKTRDSSQEMPLVFIRFLERSQDNRKEIRYLFLITSLILLEDNGEQMDWKVKQQISSKVARIILTDRDVHIRIKALDGLRTLSEVNPLCILNNELLDAMRNVCFTKKVNFRLNVYDIIADVYINLMSVLSTDSFYIPKIGKLAGILRICLTKAKSNEDEYNHLLIILYRIREFLLSLKK